MTWHAMAPTAHGPHGFAVQALISDLLSDHAFQHPAGKPLAEEHVTYVHRTPLLPQFVVFS